MAIDKFTSVPDQILRLHNLSVNTQQSYSSICQFAALLGCRIILTKERTKRIFRKILSWKLIFASLKVLNFVITDQVLFWIFVANVQNSFSVTKQFLMIWNGWTFMSYYNESRHKSSRTHLKNLQILRHQLLTAFTVLSSASSQFIWLFVLI